MRTLKILVAFAIVSGLATAAISFLAWENPVFAGDVEGFARIHLWGGEAFRRVFEIASEVTGGWQFALLAFGCAAFLLLRGKRLESIFVIMTGGSGLVSIVLKQIIGRARPLTDLSQTGTVHAGASFPSNHVVVYTVFGGLLIWLIADSSLRPLLKISGCILVLGLILVIDVSRVYTGTHWPSDVYGGDVLALFLLSIMLITYVLLRHASPPGSRSNNHSV